MSLWWFSERGHLESLICWEAGEHVVFLCMIRKRSSVLFLAVSRAISSSVWVDIKQATFPTGSEKPFLFQFPETLYSKIIKVQSLLLSIVTLSLGNQNLQHV